MAAGLGAALVLPPGKCLRAQPQCFGCVWLLIGHDVDFSDYDREVAFCRPSVSSLARVASSMRTKIPAGQVRLNRAFYTAGSSMLAMIFTVPPRCSHIAGSAPARLRNSRCFQGSGPGPRPEPQSHHEPG